MIFLHSIGNQYIINSLCSYTCKINSGVRTRVFCILLYTNIISERHVRSPLPRPGDMCREDATQSVGRWLLAQMSVEKVRCKQGILNICRRNFPNDTFCRPPHLLLPKTESHETIFRKPRRQPDPHHHSHLGRNIFHYLNIGSDSLLNRILLPGRRPLAAEQISRRIHELRPDKGCP